MSYLTSVPYRAGTRGTSGEDPGAVYASFRIPAVVVTGTGTVLAFAEGRHESAADTGRIDLVLRRSADGGRTWDDLRVVTSNGSGTAGNPAPVVTAEGRLVLVHVRNAGTAEERAIIRGKVPDEDGRRVWVQYSDDDGVTWSVPREITAAVKRPGWRWYATTPGHALQLRAGRHAGRIVVAGNHTCPPEGPDTGAEPRYNGGHCLYSDDLGETWQLGYVDDTSDDYVNPNETTAAELPDGTVYFNTRTDSRSPGNRADAVSADGGATLERRFRPQAGLVAPVVQCSVLHLGTPDVLLFSGPGHPTARAGMTIRASHDRGVTWRTAHTVDGLPAAYSDLVRLDEDTVGLLYETGDFGPYETITFRRVPLAELVS
ncbi:exo-alpha-sialidase [Streptomyces sp. NPDC088354]|uniref:sialidase family protein n=1 Tax=Streptomyces sp. NPDC088354 TaxID=3365856 RepID=UPI003823C5E2